MTTATTHRRPLLTESNVRETVVEFIHAHPGCSKADIARHVGKIHRLPSYGDKSAVIKRGEWVIKVLSHSSIITLGSRNRYRIYHINCFWAE